MSSGFIEINDKKTFSARWTIYDKILHLLITELSQIEDAEVQSVSCFLQSYTPPQNMDKDLEMGWGFITSDDVVARIVPLSELNDKQKEIFWGGVETVYAKLTHQKKINSTIKIQSDLIKELLSLR
ncbi:hypothetical protein [Bernardetia sp.]|uniref:hypothetical protein n=1 Tax=Bernardetia sp. TaxID=1937974 RepID=UPI0025BFA700|nr:hypothetical protein [Bernardetia sp.]